MISHYYPPEIGAPQARLSEMAQEWAKAGHDVTVLTGFPNHPTGVIPANYKHRSFSKEIMEGVKVWRHWLYATPNKGFLKKVICHLSFMISVVLLSLFRGSKPDIIIVSSPTFFSVVSAWFMSKVRNVPFIFEVRDLWPGIFVELGVLKNKWVICFLEKLEMFFYKEAWKVVVVTHGFKKNITDRGIPAEKIHVITNGVNLSFFEQRQGQAEKAEGLRKKLGFTKDQFIVLYIGAHGISHALSSVLEAADLCEDKAIQFLFVGEGAEKQDLIDKKDYLNLANVHFSPGVPREEVPTYYHLADACLVPLRNIECFETFIPSKMFEIMACGRPIIGSLKGESARILEKSGGAVVTAPENSKKLLAAIKQVQVDPKLGSRGYEFVRENYNREKLASDYINLLSKVRS